MRGGTLTRTGPVPARLGDCSLLDRWSFRGPMEHWHSHNNWTDPRGPVTGFENGQSPWAMFNETSGSGVLCNGPNPQQGDCYIFLRPLNGNNRVRMRTIHDVGNADLAAGGDVYQEFWVRCPSQWNDSACSVRMSVEPMNNQNDPVGSQWKSSWFSIPDNDTWYVIQVRDNPSGFPS